MNSTLSESLIEIYPGLQEIFCYQTDKWTQKQLSTFMMVDNLNQMWNKDKIMLLFPLPHTCDAPNVTLRIRWGLSCWLVQTHSWLWLFISVWQRERDHIIQVWQRPAGTNCTRIDRVSLGSGPPDPPPRHTTATMWPGCLNMESDYFTGSGLSLLSGSQRAAHERWPFTEHGSSWGGWLLITWSHQLDMYLCKHWMLWKHDQNYSAVFKCFWWKR